MNENAVLLLHGAGLGAWVWDRTLPLIPSAIALDIPSRSRDATPASCASSLVDTLVVRDADRITLVMHSLAGVLAADLALRLGERLTACVYVSAVVPAEGSTFAKTIGLPGRFLLPLLFRMRSGGLTPSENMIRKQLCTGLDEEDCAMVVDRYQAEFPGLYLTEVGAPPKCRSAYIKLTKDRSVTPAQQSRMIGRLDEPSIFEIEAGHQVMLSHPEELADVINRIVESA